MESSNPSSISSLVLGHLRSHGVPAHPTKRGIDHGVWCPLKVAFQKPFLEELTPEQRKTQQASIDTPSVLPPTLSLTQVTLPASDTSIDSLKLGASLRDLRDQGFAIVGGGMSVHNLRDLMKSFALAGGRGFGQPKPTSYSGSFLKALTEAMIVPPAERDEERWSKALKLDQRDDFLPAHPTPEHFLRKFRSFVYMTDTLLTCHHILMFSGARGIRCSSCRRTRRRDVFMRRRSDGMVSLEFQFSKEIVLRAHPIDSVATLYDYRNMYKWG